MGEGLAPLLLVLLVGTLAGGEFLARVSPGWGFARGLVVFRSIMLVGLGVYAGTLVTVSLSSKEKVLALGEPKRFCGFYLDCHLAVEVDQVDHAARIGTMRANGEFYVVKLRVSSNARQATLQMGNPEIMVLDDDGHRYGRSAAAEELVEKLSGNSDGFSRPVTAGSSFVKTVVFDIPTNARAPRLLVSDARGVDAVLEALLIGDEDSFLHRPTTHRL